MKKQNLEDLPPFLQELKEKGDGFKVPDGYFETLDDAVFARLKAAGDLDRAPKKIAKRPGLFAAFIRPQAALAYAAALAMILAAVWFFRQPDPIAPMAAVALTEDDLETYLLENAHDFEPEQLAALTVQEIAEPTEAQPKNAPKSNRSGADELHPDDLNQIIDEMTEEELEEIL